VDPSGTTGFCLSGPSLRPLLLHACSTAILDSGRVEGRVLVLDALRLEVLPGLDPSWWTPSERRLRCPACPECRSSDRRLLARESPLLDETAEFAPRRRVGGEHRSQLKIEGHLGVVILDLGDAGRLEPIRFARSCCEICPRRRRARTASPRASLASASAASTPELEELGGGSDLPPGLLEALAMRLAHDSSTFLNSASLRRDESMTYAGVARVVFWNTPSTAMAWRPR